MVGRNGQIDRTGFNILLNILLIIVDWYKNPVFPSDHLINKIKQQPVTAQNQNNMHR